MQRTRLSIIGRLMLAAAIPALLSLATLGSVQAQTLSQDCTNPDFDYTVSFPSGWYVNGHVDGGELEDVAACRFFSPDDFEVQPQSGVAGVAVSIGPEASDPPETGEATTVGGKPAIIIESETQEDGIEPAGTVHYTYWIDLGEDGWLVAGTSDAPNFVGDYEENKAVLDAMMDSLTFGEQKLPDTAMPAGQATRTGGCPGPPGLG